MTPADVIASLRAIDERAVEIQARLDAAAPGPWVEVGPLHDGYADAVVSFDSHLVANFGDGGAGRERHLANAALVAHAPGDLRVLLAERARLREDLAESMQENEDSFRVLEAQGRLLTGVVNAIRGEPAPLSLHSHHDAPELARQLVETIRHARAAQRDLAVLVEGALDLPADTLRHLALTARRARILELMQHLEHILASGPGLA